MKKIVYLATILFFMLGMVSPAVASPAADEPPPQHPNLANADIRTYLPLAVVNNSHATYTISGRIVTNKPKVTTTETINGKVIPVYTDVPINAVPVKDISNGNQVVTDANGRFQMTVRAHTKVKPDVAGYYFLPAYMEVTGDMPLTALNFTGMAAGKAPEAPNAQMIPNPSFEVLPYYWNPISSGSMGFIPYYSDAEAHTGTLSGFTGIPLAYWGSWWWGWWSGWNSLSRWRSHELLVPWNATVATLDAWIWPDSEEPTALPDARPEKSSRPANPEAMAEARKLIGYSTEDPNLPDLATDFQYLFVTDLNNIIQDVLWSDLRDDQAWVDIGPIDLVAAGYNGHVFKLEFGVYNNGALFSRAFWDDITLDITTGAVTVTCNNILLNSDMEADSDWVEKNAPQTVRPVYSTEYFWSPFRSLKTGLAPWDPIPVEPTWPFRRMNSTTEAYQAFTIPDNAAYASLSFLVKPRSTGWYGWWDPMGEKNMQGPRGQEVALRSESPDQVTSQYAYIADATGAEGLWNLFKWWNVDSYYWYARSYDLWKLRGIPFSVLFGVGNMNYSQGPVKDVLYTDDVELNVCTVGP